MTDRVLVTGGAGYIGSHACKALKSAGFVPVTFDNFSTGWRDAVKFGPVAEGDLLDRSTLDAAFREHQPVAVLHFAALSLVGDSMAEPGRYWRNNVLGSLNLVEAMLAADCRTMVFSSTCAVYAETDQLLDENSALGPASTYGATKRAVEEILRSFAVSDGLKHVIFRYFNVAGADAGGVIGEFHRPETHLIPVMLQAVEGTRAGLQVFGSDYATPDGTCIRDYVHVLDLADAHVLGLKRLLEGGEGGVFNLGSGKGYSVREVIAAGRAGTNRDVPVTYVERRAGDPRRLVSGSARALSELGWQPQHSDLAEMIRDAWRWQQAGNYRS